MSCADLAIPTAGMPGHRYRVGAPADDAEGQEGLARGPGAGVRVAVRRDRGGRGCSRALGEVAAGAGISPRACSLRRPMVRTPYLPAAGVLARGSAGSLPAGLPSSAPVRSRAAPVIPVTLCPGTLLAAHRAHPGPLRFSSHGHIRIVRPTTRPAARTELNNLSAYSTAARQSPAAKYSAIRKLPPLRLCRVPLSALAALRRQLPGLRRSG
jgi:hypothetical protein